jgi:hypothetical protein
MASPKNIMQMISGLYRSMSNLLLMMRKIIIYLNSVNSLPFQENYCVRYEKIHDPFRVCLYRTHGIKGYVT